MALIHISLIINDIDSFFICLLALNMSFFIKIFQLGCFLLIVELWELFTYSGDK